MQTLIQRPGYLASCIDHTLLKPDSSKAEVTRTCEEALEHAFAAVCVPPYFVPHVAKMLEGSKVAVATVVGFPFGYSPTSAKVSEARSVLDNGANEVDAVINRAALKSGDLAYVKNDIESLTTAVHMHSNGIIKVIIEAGELLASEVKEVCAMCAELGVDFVKTSTGFAGDVVTVDVVKLMRRSLPAAIKVKASGGIRTRKFAIELLEAGADRLGCSRSLDIIKE